MMINSRIDYNEILGFLFEVQSKNKKSIILYGAGEFTRSLLKENSKKSNKLKIDHIIDDYITSNIEGISVIKTNLFLDLKDSFIFISTDSYILKLIKNAHSLGESLEVYSLIDIFKVKLASGLQTKNSKSNKSKYKILFFTHNLNLEGAPLQMVEIARGLHYSGNFDTEFVSSLNGALKPDLEKQGFKVTILNSPLNSNTESDYAASLGIVQKIIQDSKADLVFANTLYSFYAIEAANNMNCPNVWFIHESAEDYYSFFKGYPIFLKSKSLKAFNFPLKIIFCAEYTQKLFKDFNINDNHILIKNSLNDRSIKSLKKKFSKSFCRNELKLEQTDKLIIHVGTICKRKGQLILIRAAHEILKKDISNVKFFFIGDPSKQETSYFYEFKASLNNQNITHFPATPEIYKFFLAADILVCTSNNESSPRIILEAMKFDLPIISSPLPGIKEQTRENENAIFFEDGNYHELANIITSIIDDEEKLKALSRTSANLIDQWPSYDDMIHSYSKFIQKILH